MSPIRPSNPIVLKTYGTSSYMKVIEINNKEGLGGGSEQEAEFFEIHSTNDKINDYNLALIDGPVYVFIPSKKLWVGPSSSTFLFTVQSTPYELTISSGVDGILHLIGSDGNMQFNYYIIENNPPVDNADQCCLLGCTNGLDPKNPACIDENIISCDDWKEGCSSFCNYYASGNNYLTNRCSISQDNYSRGEGVGNTSRDACLGMYSTDYIAARNLPCPTSSECDSVLQYCFTDPELLATNNACRNFCESTETRKYDCNNTMYTYCLENPTAPECACISSPIDKAECFDSDCTNNPIAYKLGESCEGMTKIDCQTILSIDAGGNIDIDHINFEQYCGKFDLDDEKKLSTTTMIIIVVVAGIIIISLM